MTSHPHIETRFLLCPGVSEFTFPQQNGHFDRKKLMSGLKRPSVHVRVLLHAL